MIGKPTPLPEEQAWLTTLEANLGAFYLPLYKMEKARGNVSAWDLVKDDPKDVRFNGEGYELLGGKVAEEITKALPAH